MADMLFFLSRTLSGSCKLVLNLYESHVCIPSCCLFRKDLVCIAAAYSQFSEAGGGAQGVSCNRTDVVVRHVPVIMTTSYTYEHRSMTMFGENRCF